MAEKKVVFDENVKDKKKAEKNHVRIREMTAVLRKYEIMKGLTPKKFRMILEDLGPTYVKIGQILSMRSDILPKPYCDELMKLHSEVAPMPFEMVKKIIQEELGGEADRIFLSIEAKPLGSASIAQAHKAVLKSKDQVVIKVQRKGIYETMKQDIALLHRVVRLIPPISLKEAVDFHMVLDELWEVTQEEMDFLKEASNMKEFAKNNRSIHFISSPKCYEEYTTKHILVMEYIDGIAIDHKQELLENGYDLEEIGMKLIDNYIKQVMDDGFFHGDPHPGNIRISGGKIVWIDMGMMGRLTQRDKNLIAKAIQGVAAKDITMIQEAVLSLGKFQGKPDRVRLYDDIQDLMIQYGTQGMGDIDVTLLLQDLMEVMKKNKIAMPNGLTMLARSMTQIEGVLVEISPDINMVEIAAAHMKQKMLHGDYWEQECKETGKRLYRSLHKAIDIPGMAAEIMQGYLNGQSKLQLDLHTTDQLSHLMRHLVRNIVLGLWVTALLVSSSILCMTNMKPKILGIPAMGAVGYFFALVIVAYTFIKHFIHRK